MRYSPTTFHFLFTSSFAFKQDCVRVFGNSRWGLQCQNILSRRYAPCCRRSLCFPGALELLERSHRLPPPLPPPQARRLQTLPSLLNLPAPTALTIFKPVHGGTATLLCRQATASVILAYPRAQTHHGTRNKISPRLQ